jgi:hypothetical protein
MSLGSCKGTTGRWLERRLQRRLESDVVRSSDNEPRWGLLYVRADD